MSIINEYSWARVASSQRAGSEGVAGREQQSQDGLLGEKRIAFMSPVEGNY